MEKSYNAQNHGAVGAIIYNNDENDIDSNIDMVNDESGRQIDIPVLWLVGRNGHMMVDSMLDVSQTGQSCKSTTVVVGHTKRGSIFLVQKTVKRRIQYRMLNFLRRCNFGPGSYFESRPKLGIRTV